MNFCATRFGQKKWVFGHFFFKSGQPINPVISRVFGVSCPLSHFLLLTIIEVNFEVYLNLKIVQKMKFIERLRGMFPARILLSEIMSSEKGASL